MNDIHFGKMILDELRKQRYSVSWFAKEMGSDRSNMYKLLDHDFFGDASKIFVENKLDRV